MHKFIYIVLFLFLSSHAFAEWTLIFSNDQTNAKYYVDLSSLNKRKETIRMMTLEDYIAPEIAKKGQKKISYNSVKTLSEFNCSSQMMRVLSYSVYKNQMAFGEPILSKGIPFEWSRVNHNTVNDAYLNIACNEIN